MRDNRETEPPEQRFRSLWGQHSPRVLAYALRHVDRDAAHDVVSDTFLVAWRRLESVPDDPLPWLLVVARNTLANHRRSSARRARLATELERLGEVAEPAPAADVLATERAAVLAALAALTPREREALLLVGWDGLSARQAAQVAGCSTPAFQVRLFRARRRLLAAADPEARPHPDTVTQSIATTGGPA